MSASAASVAPDLPVVSPLRDEILLGRFARPGAQAVAARLEAFLSQDPHSQEWGALAVWFGDGLATTLRADPERLRGCVDRDIAAIDALIGAQLDAVLHDPRLQRLEGSWRGLAWLIAGFDPDARLKARLLSATWEELDRDASRSSQFDQSALFRLVYENEFGSAGGEPFGLLVIDHELRHILGLRKRSIRTRAKPWLNPIRRATSMVVRDGPDGDVHIPALYDHAETESDSLRLGRPTEWTDSAPVRGSGQRNFLVGDEGVAVQQLTTLEFE